MQQSVLIDTLFDTHSRPLQAPRCLLLVASGVLLLAVCAQLSFHLPFTPILLTAQTFAVLLLGLTYGRRLGVATISSYILAGSLGLPVFSGGQAGLPLFIPSGGYLIGYWLAVLLCGYLAERGWTHSAGKLALAMLLGLSAIYLCGLAQLSFFVKEHLLAIGLYPFMPGEAVKMALVVLLLPPVCRLVQDTR